MRFFDHASLTCRLFCYDGCRGRGYFRNMFDDFLTRQWLCEEQPMHKSSRVNTSGFDSIGFEWIRSLLMLFPSVSRFQSIPSAQYFRAFSDFKLRHWRFKSVRFMQLLVN
ncbi:hypothetical protein L596_012958 [Steinernema carpocapsae]|uniref:Uncharacterized protein n=1 Tax=Steinernema carpocapsae TaxID=34508 RepID=A0A4V6XWF8_STECR|nr:hypothetical protein L596_012958 [Steinernema carpocapsae]